MTISIDETWLIQTLTDLVNIDSVNPDLVPGGVGEGAIAAYIENVLRELDVAVDTHELEFGRSNVIGTIKGQGEGRSLMLNAHTDTVGYHGMQNPLGAEIRDGKMYGRGAFDMKASLAACLAIFKALTESDVQLAGDLLLTAVIDEEHKSLGTQHLVEHYTTDGAIVTEPTGMRVCCGHRGFVWYDVEVTGRAAHGSRYQDGIDANTKMGYLLVELDKFSKKLLMRDGHPLFGPPSMHVPLINGGSSQSVYAARCKIEIERRIIPGESNAQALGEIQAVIDLLSAHDPEFKAVVTETFSRDAFEVAEDAPIVQELMAANQEVRGLKPDVYGELWWMDSALIAAAGIETVIFGPSGAGAHADEEWVDLDSVMEFARVVADASIRYCGVSDD